MLFSPTFDPLTGTLLALTTHAVGFVARPLGGHHGHYDDRIRPRDSPRQRHSRLQVRTGERAVTAVALPAAPETAHRRWTRSPPPH